jgi:hypothetical protein
MKDYNFAYAKQSDGSVTTMQGFVLFRPEDVITHSLIVIRLNQAYSAGARDKGEEIREVLGCK